MDTCIVKLVYNTGQSTSYKINFQDSHVWITICLASLPGDLTNMLVRIKDDLIFKKPYRVIFNSKSIPSKIQSSKEFISFKESMLKLLGKSTTPTMDTWFEILKLHIQRGKAPNLADYDDPTTLVRISNYMTSVLNTTVTHAQVIELCQKLINSE